jgi:hypothetical protein
MAAYQPPVCFSDEHELCPNDYIRDFDSHVTNICGREYSCLIIRANTNSDL